MESIWKPIIWGQFGAAIDMLENALIACPEELWANRTEKPEYWYLVFHTLFWLDLYLTGSVEEFSPPKPFTLAELDPAGAMPERVYSKEELQVYLSNCRRKCRETIKSLTDERANQPAEFSWLKLSFSELLLYNMRHVQHHAAQLNLILRRKCGAAPCWVSQARDGQSDV